MKRHPPFSADAVLGDRRQGIRPDAARPADVRHDDRHSAAAARAVRLRHQLRSASICPPPCCWPTTGRRAARCCTRSATAATSTSSAQVQTRERRPRRAGARRGAVRRSTSRRTSPATCCAATGRRCWSKPTRPIRPRRATRSARLRTLDRHGACRTISRARSPFSPAPPARSNCASTPATTPRRSRSTTSCRA